MNRLMTALVLGSVVLNSYAFTWDKPHKDTTTMLALYSKATVQYGLQPTDSKIKLIMEAMRVCIVDQMKESGCDKLLSNLK